MRIRYDLDFVGEREGVRTIAVPMERHISLWKDMKSLVKMIGVFRRERPYMVHSMTPKAGLVCMMAAWLTRVPVRVHTFTGLVWPTSTGLKRKILMMMDDALREKIKKNARPMIVSRFERGFVRKCLYEFYEEIM